MQRMKDTQAKARRSQQYTKRRRTVAESLAQGYQHNEDQDLKEKLFNALQRQHHFHTRFKDNFVIV